MSTRWPTADVGLRPTTFKVKARISRSDAQAIQDALEQLAAKGSITKAARDFIVEAEVEGPSARELNRTLLSALRKVRMEARLRAEWVSSDKTVETFFDYTLRKRSRNGLPNRRPA